MTKPAAARHPIRVVARRTGLSVDLIRAWESRHGVVAPARTETGRRLYADDDIERLTLLRRAIEAGRGIGHVAGLSTAELKRLVSEDAGPAAGASEAGPVDEALAALERHDAEAVEAALRSAAVRLPVTELIETVLAPLLREVGERWHRGGVTVVQEHLATGIVRAVLASLPRQVNASRSAPLMIAATLTGERHEVGVMMAAATAWGAGWRVIYLGADVPAAEIGTVARTTGAAVIALSITCATDAPGVPDGLKALRRTARRVDLVAGGRAAGDFRKQLQAARATVLGDMRQLRSFLNSHSHQAA